MSTTTDTAVNHRAVNHPSGVAWVVNADGVTCALFAPTIRHLYGGAVEAGTRYTCPDGTNEGFYLGSPAGNAERWASMLDEFDDPTLPL